MSNINLKYELIKFDEQTEVIKTKLKNYINNISNNPDDVKELNSNCFTMSNSKLSDNLILSPFYYDFRLQQKLLIDIINNHDFEQIYKRIKSIVEQEGIVTISGVKYVFNPTVVKYLKELI